MVDTFMKVYPLIDDMGTEEIIKKEADFFKFDITKANRKFIPFQVSYTIKRKVSKILYRLYSSA